MTDLYGNIPISGDPSHRPDPPPQKAKKVGKLKKAGSPEPPLPKGRTVFLVIPGILLFLMASYYGLTSLALPFYLEKKLPDIFFEKTGLNLSLGSVQFNPLNSTLVLQELDIDSNASAPQENDDILEIATVLIDFNLASIWKKAVITDALQINTLHLHVRRYQDNSLNIAILLADSQHGDPGLFNTNMLSFPHSLNNIAIDGGKVVFDDQVTAKVHRAEQLRLRLPTIANVSYQADKYLPPEFFAIINGSPLKLTGGDNIAHSSPGQQPTRLTFALQSVDLALYAQYLPVQLPLVVLGGEAEITTEISLQNPDNSAFQPNIDFQALITNGTFASQDKTLVLDTPSLRLEGTAAPLDRRMSLKNVLFRNPSLTVQEAFADTTLKSLFPRSDGAETTPGAYQHSTEFDLGLLIVDNGSVVIQREENERSYDNIQISIRNYLNRAALQSVTSEVESSFLISGEANEGFLNFTWQGNFEHRMPTGDIVINNLPAVEIMEILSADDQLSAAGSAEIRGRLRFEHSATSPIFYVFDRGKVVLSSFNLKEKGQDILQSPAITMSPVRINDKVIDVGNVFIERGKLAILRQRLPFTPLSQNQKRELIFSVLDYQGDITLSADRKDNDPLVMSDGRLQFKTADEQESTGENFVYTANLASGGSVTAKGNISVNPLAGSIDLAVGNAPATTFLPTALAQRFAITGKTSISVTGNYSLTTDIFNGEAEIARGAARNSDTGTAYTFAGAILDKISINYGSKSGKASAITLQELDITQGTYRLESSGGTISSLAVADNTLSLGDISLNEANLTLPADSTKTPASFMSTTASGLSIDGLKMSGKVSIAGSNRDTQPFLDNYFLNLRDLGSAAELVDNLEFSASFHEKGDIEASGVLTIFPLRTKLNASLVEVPAQTLGRFSPLIKNLKLQADLSGQLSYTYPGKMYTGDLSLLNGRLADGDDTRLRWAEVSLVNLQLRASPFQLTANRCLLRQPQAVFTKSTSPTIATIQRNIASHFEQLDILTTTPDSPVMVIGRVEIEDGVLNYRDNSMSPAWQTEISSFSGKMDNFHTGESQDSITYSFRGNIGEGAFNIGGAYEQGAAIPTKLQNLEIASFPLAELEQQLISMFDISLAESRLSASLNNETAPDKGVDLSISAMDAANPQSATALALALLSYDEDVFAATIPLAPTNQSFFTQATRYFQKLMVKASVSPYLLLQDPFDSLEGNRTISFSPGTAKLSSEAKTVLSTYGMLLQSRPRLMLKLRPTIQRSADTIALREILRQREAERVMKENEKRLEAWQQQQLNQTPPANPDDSIAVVDIPTDQLAEFTPITSDPVVITEEILKNLAFERAEMIRNFFTSLESVREEGISTDYHVEFINTLDLPVVNIELAHVDGS